MRLQVEKVRPWLTRLALWGLVGAGVYALLTQAAGGELLAPGVEAPPVGGTTLGGNRFDLGSQRGQVTVVNFWATWCPPCRAEAPALARIHRRLERSGGTVVGVSMDTAPLSEVEPAARQLGMRYPIVIGTGQMQADYRVQQLPTTYVVGPGGTVARAAVGAVTDEWLEDAVEAAQDF